MTPKNTPMRAFWQKAESPDDVAAAVQLFHDERKRNPNAILFPEAALNLLGYQLLQDGRIGKRSSSSS